MDIKQLLEKIDQFAGQAVGQKPGEQWRGTDKGTPGKKLVGGDEQQESVLKDLSKGRTPKTREQELAEEWATFSEENIGTHPKRARRTSDRHNRGHEPQARYKTVKADEAANPAQQAAIAIAMKKAGKKPKNEGAEQDPIVAKVVKQMRPGLTGLDMGNEAFLYFAYELGKQRARDAWEDYLPAIRAEYEQGLAEGWKDAAVGAAMLGALGGTAAYVHNQPHVEVDGVKWTITKHTPGPLAHPHIGTGADGKQYQVWRGSKGMHLAHPIDSKQVDETIVKVGSQYELKSHTGKNLGKYPTKAGAKKREQQVNYFKHVKEDAWTGDNPAWNNGTDQWHSADDGSGGGVSGGAPSAPLTGALPIEEDFNPQDVVSVDVPLLIRLLEYAREDAKTDMDLHNVTERLIALSQEGNTLTMQDYDTICNTKETD